MECHQQISNCDETNLTDNPKTKMMIFRKGIKYAERIINTAKSAISIMFACTASGHMLSPYVVYKAERLQDTWMKGEPIDVHYDHTKSGWFDSSVFHEWVNKVITPYVKTLPANEWKMVIGDNLPSHFSFDLVKLCNKHKIRIAFFPPNSTGLLQPLVVAVYGPLKRAWKEVLTEWKMGDSARMTTLPKWCFPKLLLRLLQTMSTKWSKLSRAGFRGCGIYPFDPDHILRKLRHEDKDKYPPSQNVSAELLQYLKETRESSVRHNRPRSKKVNVEPGKCYSCLADLEKSSTSGTSTLAPKQKHRRKASSSSDTPDFDEQEHEPDMNQPSTSGTQRQQVAEVNEEDFSDDEYSEKEVSDHEGYLRDMEEQSRWRERNDSEEER